MQGKELSEPDATLPVYAGVDVCKDWLDIYVHPGGQCLRVCNDRFGLKKLKRALSALGPVGVVMEATGKHHRAAHRSLHAAGFAVAVVNPLRARLFAEAIGQLAKTDRLDARLLALMGAALAPAAHPPPPQLLEALAELVNARHAAASECTALINRLAAATTGFLKAELRRRIAACRTHIARIEKHIARHVADHPDTARRFAILTSIPGIGPVTAQAMITGLRELGACSARQATLLAGLAPLADDSGGRSGYRSVRGGRKRVRNALYMAALTAMRKNPDLATFANRLKGAGKRPKVVIVAVMRKLLVLANTLITQDRLWIPHHP